MKLWTSPDVIPPAIEVLVRRWNLPVERVDDVKRLLAAEAEGGTACALPAAAASAEWGEALAAEFDVSPAPLVRVKHSGKSFLQSWRFFQVEKTIAEHLLGRAARQAPALSRSSGELLAALGEGQVNPRQGQAIVCALEHGLALVTGGPGTGKTHTLARLLALLIADRLADEEPVILLGAPTGKAAERMREAVEGAADRLPASLPVHVRERLKSAAAGASTLHKLLGFNPSTGRCRHNADTPLACDVLIVDECSMVDALLWRALLAALPAGARLVLLGDPNQLESVAAGDVLGAVVRHARARPESALARAWVELNESQRFKHRPGIGALAEAIVGQRADEASALLAAHVGEGAPDDGLVWLGDHGGRFSWDRLPASVRAAIEAAADAVDPAEALAALGRVRLLTAHREGALGAAGINAAITGRLTRRVEVSGRLPNEPIIVNENDSETGLTNGSVGVVTTDATGGRTAWFPAASAGDAPRRLPAPRLPSHGPAWAMTIHRSQGSEFSEVVVVMPPEASPLATRELIYTAITRAKDRVHVWGAEASLRAALSPRAMRCTLLDAALARAQAVEA